jgi:hypothetical protein
MKNILIHIGFPKSGSTFLQKYFSQHSELHYDQTFFKEYRKSGKLPVDLDELSRSCNHLILSEEQLSVWGGGIKINTTSFGDFGIKKHQEDIAKQLCVSFPKAKILIVVRGFDTLFHSLYSQYISVGGIMDWNQFKNADHSAFVQFYDYDFAISLYEKYFGKDKLLVLPYELLKKDAQLFLQKIESFSQIKPLDFENVQVNQSMSSKDMKDFLKLSRIFTKALKLFPNYRFKRFIYREYGEFLYKKKEKLNQKDKVDNTDINDFKDILIPLKGTTDKLVQREEIKAFVNHYLIN